MIGPLPPKRPTWLESLRADKRFPRLLKRAEMRRKVRPLGWAVLGAIVRGESAGD